MRINLIKKGWLFFSFNVFDMFRNFLERLGECLESLIDFCIRNHDRWFDARGESTIERSRDEYSILKEFCRHTIPDVCGAKVLGDKESFSRHTLVDFWIFFHELLHPLHDIRPFF